jgi:hypothetical protein
LPFLDPGYAAYSLGIFHQMHCLYEIRKALYAKNDAEDTHKDMDYIHTSKYQTIVFVSVALISVKIIVLMSFANL